MNSIGIRILDEKNGVISVGLPDILREIQNGNMFYWSILYLYATGDLGENKSIPDFEEQINKSENGFFIDWNDLNELSKKFYQVIDLTLIGSKDKNFLQRYKEDRKMYEKCDIVIEMIDSGCWQVFSKDGTVINKLAAKFKEIKLLDLEKNEL